MCDLNCSNLIDLSLEDDTSCDNMEKTEGRSQPIEDCSFFVSPNWDISESLENNPFDRAQKVVDRRDDLFDIVEKEACLKALQAFKPATEVKLGNLLSLSDDDLLDKVELSDTKDLSSSKTNNLDLESPPVVFYEKHHLDGVSSSDSNSNPSSSAESSTSAKLKKSIEHRKRLLKLSISNAAFNSPITRKLLTDEDALCTPVSSILSKAAEFGENLLATESPLKLVEDGDLISEEAPNFVDSDKNFEADLEMLKIPMLNELPPSPDVEQTSVKKKTENLVKMKDEILTDLENDISSIIAIKAKLKAKKEEIESNHQQEISSLIQNLRTLISNGEIVNRTKKQQASALLESLSSALTPCNKDDTLKPSGMILEEPLLIKRQGTFDMDLLEKQEAKDIQPLAQEMPNCMVSSSATYDGETPAENQDLNLPEIAPLSPRTSPSTRHYKHNDKNDCENNLQDDVNDIMEQLSKLLINNTAENSQHSNNPTFIVVMNANKYNHSNINVSNPCAVNPKQTSVFVSNYLESSIKDSSSDSTKVNCLPRRRSQSLSIHDKVKIVQIPLQKYIPRSLQEQQSVQWDDSRSIYSSPPSVGYKTPEFKTRARVIRRNSYSSGTPFTAQVGVRRPPLGSESNNPTQMRKFQTLDTHLESDQHAVIRPINMPSNNLTIFKPDLRKKGKHNTESIIKSSGPLKATIPVKKVAPILKTSPPTPESNTRSNSLLNISLQRKSKISRVPTTPLRAKGSTLALGVGYPNACSTPTTSTSPLKRTSGPVNKPRYSYSSATPNRKSPVNNSSAESLKRRTITEFKNKPPVKPRVTDSADLAVASSSRVSVRSSRLSATVAAKFSKTPVKTSNIKTTTTKPITRLNSRMSFAGSTFSAKNKENKSP